ncbi:hypothetical protein LCGC14_2129490 [marine sediment metagenome]|uniref:Uncharacterized protein n=1 Tax=marine sediment metagenome TaxID=412755 RepID=A0A0F9E1W1_9ZZZZ
MKLYAWQPKGHGEYSFFVCAEDKEGAEEAVNKYIHDHLNKDDDEYLFDYCIDGWGTDYYVLTEVEPMTVIINDND